jgi:hypothetical protein
MKKKYKLLILSILLDIVGMLSFIIPVLGEFTDVIWAPLAAYLMIKIYPGTEGKIASFITFIEEAGIFGTDLLPTFSLTWMYKYLLKGEVSD